MKRNFLKKILSVCLAVITVAFTPLTVFSANTVTYYENGIIHEKVVPSAYVESIVVDKNGNIYMFIGPYPSGSVRTSGPYTYTVSNGEATLLGVSVDRDSEYDLIPETLGGCPVTGIGNMAFDEVSHYSTINIPAGIKSIGSRAFDNCEFLRTIKVSEDNESFKSVDGVLFSKDGTTLVRYPRAKTGDSYVIPDGVVTIWDNAFDQGCRALKSVTIPEGVTSIGSFAFRYNSGITEIVIPDSVTNIGYSAFRHCTSLSSINMSDTVKTMGGYAFYDTGYYHDTENWDGEALYFGKYLLHVNRTITGSYKIKEGTSVISDYAFDNCKELESVTIPDGITSISRSAFNFCESLTELVIPDTVTSIEKWAFNYCAFESIDIPDSVTYIGERAFQMCRSLKSFSIPSGVTAIEEGTFNGCKFTSINIPDTITSVGKEAFKGCVNLTSVRLSNNVTSIGEAAFEKCESLTIECGINSTALEYAKDNLIPYTTTDHTTPYDLNGDGKTNLSDASALMKYVAAWKMVIDRASADANGDGMVNLSDATILMQYIANWNVTLG